MLHLFFSVVYGLVLLASLACLALVDRPIRALSAAVTEQRQDPGQASHAPAPRKGMQALGLWLTLSLLVLASACTYNASHMKVVVDAGRVD